MPSFRRKSKVSVWLGYVNVKSSIDILKTFCGVEYYDLDSQEVAIGKRKQQVSVESLLRHLSYADTFSEQVLKAASAKGLKSALYLLAQYDFAYDPAKAKGKIAADPVFVGAFRYDSDGEEDKLPWD